MVIVMDMSNGKIIGEESEYIDEALNAGWLPQPELALGLQSAVPAYSRHARNIADPDSFLRTVYCCQE